ncbi:MAG: hypothetical protein P1U77_12960 [Rubripirellula sp.]|jgi:hypothetical protein|nr:hypothetical protein [Rubripirellula sp.]
MSPNLPRVFEFYPLEDRFLLSGDSVDAADLCVDPDAAIADALLADLAPEWETTANMHLSDSPEQSES